MKIARWVVAPLVCALILSGGCSSALAAEQPAAPSLAPGAVAVPTNFSPGDSTHSYSYELRITNLGAEATDGSPITVTDTLAAGLEVKGVQLRLRADDHGNFHDFDWPEEEICSVAESQGSEAVTCTISESIPAAEPAKILPDEARRIVVEVFTPASVPQGTALDNRIEVEGGGAPPASSATQNEASSQPATSGFSNFASEITGPNGAPETQAGSHPFQFVSSFAVHTNRGLPGTEAAFVPAAGDLKDIEVALPPGLIGNPTATPRCTFQQFNTIITLHFDVGSPEANECPEDSAVGVLLIQQVQGEGGSLPSPIYNLTPTKGLPAVLGVQVAGEPFYINAEVRPGQAYRVSGTLRNLSQLKRLTAATVVLWGAPGDPRHDSLRGKCVVQLDSTIAPVSLGSCPGSGDVKPFLRLPTSCGQTLSPIMSVDTWSAPGTFLSQTSQGPAVTGCETLGFEPSMAIQPTSNVADSPTGLEVDLHMPQKENEDVEGTGQSDLDDVTVSLPAGLAVNPSGANGLQACDLAQIDLAGDEAAQCPASSRIGEVEVDTPLLESPLSGGVYVATPFQNPFDSLLAIYVAVADPVTGVVVKLAGKVQANPENGQLTATFDENPQLPFEDFKLRFFDGAGAALRSPQVCGSFSTTYELTPYSAPGSSRTGNRQFTISDAPGGGSCPTNLSQLPNAPTFAAGTVEPTAGAFSPFVVRLQREDGSQEFSSLSVTPPSGLLARLAGVPYCPDSALVAAAGRSGRDEEAHPDCPEASQIGTVQVAAGAGPDPYHVRGRAYLAGPYKGAPLSLAIITPATAGPYDLGTVVVRAALRVDPLTAQVSATSDRIPRILDGIPLDVRSIEVRLDRPQFTLNPTSCNPFAVGASLTSTQASTTSLSNRFQVGDCERLAFKPKLKLSLKGGTRRAALPALKAVVTYPSHGVYANIARAQVNLPHSEFLEQNNLNKTCTRPVLLEGRCPRSTIYGKAKAWTPLLEKPLEGPVYLVGGFGYKLPALVAELNGQIRVLLVGKVDAGPNKGIRTTFEAVPDAPVSRFVLKMKGGKKYGLLVNSEDLCKATKAKRRAIARFTGQNGKVDASRPVIAIGCGKHRKKTNGRHRHAGGKG